VSWIDAYEFGGEFDDLRANPERARFWSDEILREVPAGHELFGRDWIVIAEWAPQDEVVVRSGDEVAVVHLTFTKQPPERLPYPTTRFLGSAAEFEAFFEFR
jgi:hypothetical protein